MMRAAASVVIGVWEALPAFEDLLMEFFLCGLPNWQCHPLLASGWPCRHASEKNYGFFRSCDKVGMGEPLSC